MYNINYTCICISNVDRVFETVNAQSETKFSRIEINKVLKEYLCGHYSISFENIQLTLKDWHQSNTSPQHKQCSPSSASNRDVKM